MANPAFTATMPPDIARLPMDSFDTENVWPWIVHWLKAQYQMDIESTVNPAEGKHPFPTYPASGERGHYDLSALELLAPDGSIRIAVAGDWGTGTNVAQQVADSMGNANPELTIRLGDLYYVGLPEEVEQNCNGQDSGPYLGVSWRKGTKGSFALNANHEMYSGGHGYFENFLPTLGIPSSQDRKQLTSYFCLETPGWRILGIDTGYNADTLAGDCTLDQSFLGWLTAVVNPAGNRKPTVLLSHHQWYSGFGDGNYPKPAEQMTPFFPGQEIVWLWGHEHRLAIYNKWPPKRVADSLTAWGRCIGHGGMPIEMPADNWDTQHPDKLPDCTQVEFWDGDPRRRTTLKDGTEVGKNGYALMTIAGPSLTIEYYDADGITLVLRERFEPAVTGFLEGNLTRTIVTNPEILDHMTWGQAAR